MRVYKGKSDARAARLDDDEPAWRPVARRILLGVALVVVGLVWSILNGTIWAPKQSPRGPVVAPHGIVAASVRRLDDMRVRPEVLTTVGSGGSADATDIRVTLHNDAASARPVGPRDVYLHVDGRAIAPAALGDHPLHPTMLAPGGYVVGALRFAHALSPGATLVYAPSWAGGRSVRWLLYQ